MDCVVDNSQKECRVGAGNVADFQKGEEIENLGWNLHETSLALILTKTRLLH